MTSYLIISSDNQLLEQKFGELCDDKQISPFDKTIFDISLVETKTGTKKSWGIDDIKSVQKKIFLKPLKGEWKAVIIKDADLLTQEAQNAMLKILEEPPTGTLFILTAATDAAFLPTILSRCTIIKLDTSRELSTEEAEQISSDISALNQAGIGERLKKAEVLSKDKQNALSWITNAILSLHADVESDDPQQFYHLTLLHQAYKTVKTTNANLRLTLENLFLQWE